MKIEKRTKLSSLPKQTRVTAYVRVSTDKDSMLHSLSAQVSNYMRYFKKGDRNEGVYAYKQLLIMLKRVGVITQNVDNNNVFG